MKYIITFLITSLVYFLSAKEAWAYIDLGSGSFIIQLILGAVLGGLVTLKIYFKKIKAFIFKKNKLPKEDKGND